MDHRKFSTNHEKSTWAEHKHVLVRSGLFYWILIFIWLNFKDLLPNLHLFPDQSKGALLAFTTILRHSHATNGPSWFQLIAHDQLQSLAGGDQKSNVFVHGQVRAISALSGFLNGKSQWAMSRLNRIKVQLSLVPFKHLSEQVISLHPLNHIWRLHSMCFVHWFNGCKSPQDESWGMGINWWFRAPIWTLIIFPAGANSIQFFAGDFRLSGEY